MAKKAILFARVSSNQQSYERQKSDLLPIIQSDGYKLGEVAYIQHKESATKNDVQNRKSISELTDLVENEPIEAVYVTEISRLARRGDVMYAVMALLESKKICLVVQQPMMLRTYDKQGKPNAMAHVVIAFLSQAAVAESDLKLERQMSGYKQKKLDGKVVSSRVKYGYKRINGYAVEDNEQSKVVNDIFQLYLDGYSVTTISDKYKHQGIFGKINDKSGWNKVTRLLRDTTYIGQNLHFKYPQIVSTDLFEAVNAKMDDNQLIKTNISNVYYAQGIVKLEGKHTMTPNASQATYTFRNCETKKTLSVSANVIDSLAYDRACIALLLSSRTTTQERKRNAVREAENALKSLNGIDDELKEKDNELERINYMYQKGKYSEDKWLFESERIEGEISHLLKEKEDTKLLIKQLNHVIEVSSQETRIEDHEALLQITDDNKKRDIVKKHIESINIKPVSKGQFEIYVTYVDKTINIDSHYTYIQKGCKVRLFDGNGEDYTYIVNHRIRSLSQRKKAEV